MDGRNAMTQTPNPPSDTTGGTIGVCRWQVFENPDGDEGGWLSYVDDGTHYLGGDLHRTKAKAVAHAHQIAKAASNE
jgi:hypothetical protein